MNHQELAQIVEQVVQAVDRSERQTSQYADVTLDFAKRLIEAVEQKAAQMGVNAVIAVANRGANPVAVHCMDNAYIASYDIAFHKAYTCAALKMSTTELKKLAQPGEALYGIQHTNNGKIVIFGGGIPIMIDGQCIGGLGVSGGSEEQDSALAEYARTIIQSL